MDHYSAATHNTRATYAQYGALLDKLNGENLLDIFTPATLDEIATNPRCAFPSAIDLESLADFALAGIEQHYGHDAAIKALARAEGMALLGRTRHAVPITAATQARFSKRIARASKAASEGLNVTWEGQDTLAALKAVCDALAHRSPLIGNVKISQAPFRLLNILTVLVGESFPAIYNAAEHKESTASALEVEAYKLNVLTLPHLMMTHEVLQKPTAQALEVHAGFPYLAAALGEVIKALRRIVEITLFAAPNSNPTAATWLREVQALASGVKSAKEAIRAG